MLFDGLGIVPYSRAGLGIKRPFNPDLLGRFVYQGQKQVEGKVCFLKYGIGDVIKMIYKVA